IQFTKLLASSDVDLEFHGSVVDQIKRTCGLMRSSYETGDSRSTYVGLVVFLGQVMIQGHS
nr:hypothetical protein [Tanacetum cinerariifolium]